MMFNKYNAIVTVVATFVLIDNCILVTVGLQNSFSAPLIFVTGNEGYTENTHLRNNMLRESDINNAQTDHQKNLRKKDWPSFAVMPMLKSNAVLQCNSNLFINNSVLTSFSLAFAQMSDEIPEMHRVFNLANLPKDVAEKNFRNVWRDVLLKYSIPHASDTAQSLSKIVSSAFDGVTPEECKCSFPTGYGLPLLNAGILTRYNANYLASMLVNFMYSTVKKANPTDPHDIYKKSIEGVEMFLKMVGINMVEELPKTLLSLVYLVRFYGKN